MEKGKRDMERDRGGDRERGTGRNREGRLCCMHILEITILLP